MTFPWEPKPADCKDLIWRSEKNPIIVPERVPGANSIFNSALVPFQDAYAGVFRVDNRARESRLHVGHSTDGLDWQIDPEPIQFECDVEEISVFTCGYDPRITPIDGRYLLTWCNDYHGPTIGMAWTQNFKTFHQMENAFLPANRNGVLFPRTIDGRYAMLSRPSDLGHTPFGDIFYSESPDLCFWGRHRFVMGPSMPWTSLKIGAGPVPIEIEDGWLLIYHGVLRSCSGYVYAAGTAILDKDQPWKVLHRSHEYLMGPKELYERVGDVPNVLFPCATLHDEHADRLVIYYGGADTVVAVAYAHLSEVISWTRQ